MPKSRKRQSLSARHAPAAGQLRVPRNPGAASLFRLRGPLADGAQESVLKRATPAGEKPLVDIDVKAEFRPASRGIAPEQSIACRSQTMCSRLNLPMALAPGCGATSTAPDSVALRHVMSVRSIWKSQRASRSAPAGASDSRRDRMGTEVAQDSWRGRACAHGLGLGRQRRETQRTATAGIRALSLRTRNRPVPAGAVSLPTKAADERPYLVFLHGTLSSTWGSFRRALVA